MKGGKDRLQALTTVGEADILAEMMNFRYPSIDQTTPDELGSPAETDIRPGCSCLETPPDADFGKRFIRFMGPHTIFESDPNRAPKMMMWHLSSRSILDMAEEDAFNAYYYGTPVVAEETGTAPDGVNHAQNLSQYALNDLAVLGHCMAHHDLLSAKEITPTQMSSAIARGISAAQRQLAVDYGWKAVDPERIDIGFPLLEAGNT